MIIIIALALSLSAASAANVYSIAFTSALTSDDVKLANGQGLKYQLTLFNSGNAYDNKTGIFTCPQSGIYQFNIHAVRNGASDESRLQIVHNQDFVVSLYGGEPWTSGGNSAIMHLKRGDMVWVRSLGTSSLRGRRDALYTTFSGFLIAPSFE